MGTCSFKESKCSPQIHNGLGLQPACTRQCPSVESPLLGSIRHTSEGSWALTRFPHVGRIKIAWSQTPHQGSQKYNRPWILIWLIVQETPETLRPLLGTTGAYLPHALRPRAWSTKKLNNFLSRDVDSIRARWIYDSLLSFSRGPLEHCKAPVDLDVHGPPLQSKILGGAY